MVLLIPTALSLFERVLITNRMRIILRSMEDDEEVAYSWQRWMFSRRGKPILSQENDITKLVRGFWTDYLRWK